MGRSIVLLIWHWFAFLVAGGLIASGNVHRAKSRAFRKRVISAIYFHNPNPHLLRRCIRWLKRNGYTFVSADDVIASLRHGKPLPPGAVWLSFDDGWSGILTDAIPLCREYGVPVTLFIPSGVIEGDGRFPFLHDPNYRGAAPVRKAKDTAAREAMTLDQLREIARLPEVTLGSHTVSHCITPFCTGEELSRELEVSKQKLESWSGKPVICFAYPEGRFDGRERQYLVKHGFELAVTTESAFITAETDRFAVPRFSVGDDVSFAQAVCSMVGVWRPLIDSMKPRARSSRRSGTASRKPDEPGPSAKVEAVPSPTAAGAAQKSGNGVMPV